jgi:D-sedoheptulose 7-phosphate isomerase
MKLPRPTPDHLGDYIARAASTIFTLENQLDELDQLAALVIKTLKAGNKILTAGNGGSAAEALHLAEELTGRYVKPRKALAAICLNADPTALTCIANDWDFDHIFARQVEALARKDDLLVLFTTSGNSANCIQAARAMKKAGGKTIGLLGKNGGKIKKLCDLPLVIDSQTTSHIQEAHQVVLHLILEAVDANFS